ncbi:MAG: septal ring lytic transglycosylase RlpA family lipoprotein [Ectothiorhodospiraceae bacterium]|nr:septal ring lytic transglycosylase RlpA family lipoprotein [Ectothiorhodospiraceae bacterium]
MLRHLILFSATISFLLSVTSSTVTGQEGEASYYANKFHGKPTASGERYNMWAMTAAHRTLPFDTKVKVTNIDNGKSVVVRINDRGPFKPGRIIDLSKAAAAEIDMIKSGTAPVRIERVELGESIPDEPTEYFDIKVQRRRLKGYGVQLASLQDLGNLIHYLDKLEAEGIANVFVQIAYVKKERFYRVVIGGFESRETAANRLAELKRRGFDGFVFTMVGTEP